MEVLQLVDISLVFVVTMAEALKAVVLNLFDLMRLTNFVKKVGGTLKYKQHLNDDIIMCEIKLDIYVS